MNRGKNQNVSVPPIFIYLIQVSIVLPPLESSTLMLDYNHNSTCTPPSQAKLIISCRGLHSLCNRNASALAALFLFESTTSHQKQQQTATTTSSWKAILAVRLYHKIHNFESKQCPHQLYPPPSRKSTFSSNEPKNSTVTNPTQSHESWPTIVVNMPY